MVPVNDTGTGVLLLTCSWTTHTIHRCVTAYQPFLCVGTNVYMH